MIDVAIIPARGGSKGLPGKNIKPLCGKPLIAWTIEACIASNCFNRVIVTTDCTEIASVSRQYGAEIPFMRPPEFSSDFSTSVEVVQHFLSQIVVRDTFAFLQPTSPLRNCTHIQEAFDLFQKCTVGSLVSVTKSKPVSWLFSKSSNGALHNYFQEKVATQRQLSNETYCPNGAIYFHHVESFQHKKEFIPNGCIGYEMSNMHSIDIDTLDDFNLVEAIIEKGL